jgi:undecaprenyl-diphosphatase
MHELAYFLLQLDESVTALAHELRWGPATIVFVLLSAWWMKGFIFVLAGGLADLRNTRSSFPAGAVFAGISVAAGGVLTGLLKDSFDRDRPEPAGVGLEPAVATPGDPSFPSGHTATAFAGAMVVAALYPRLRWPALGLAALVGLSRVYLGVHFALDVLAGAALGIIVGTAAVWAGRRVLAQAHRLRPSA